ncbi:MAG: PorV/PorQ family protein [Candidatus Cloacimonetes bacterium]|nr:PorV/PorQ family protein [Candidatus Cloacimonadota bacterium]
MKKIILSLTVFILLNISLFGKVFPKTGTASLQFLKLGIDARAIGMGEAYTAVTDDISSVYWNPAGLALNDKKQIFLSHTNWVADTYHEFLAVSTVNDYGYFAIFTSFFYTDEMEETTEPSFGPTGRKFYFTDLAAGVTYANAFTDKFSFGVTGKYLREDIADENINSYSFDFGTLYNTMYRNIIIGMSLRNFGPEVQYQVDNKTENPIDEEPYDPFNLNKSKLGTAFQIPLNFSLGVAGDLYREDDDSSYLIASVQLDNCVDRKETWNLGTEYKCMKTMFLRAGYQIGYDAATWSGGFGVKFASTTAVFNVDYAYTDMGRLKEDFMSSAHRLSLKMSF